MTPISPPYYYGARYYDTVIGRFISPDSLVPEALNPQSLNRYSYVINNPVNHIDPTGHCFFIIDCFFELFELLIGPIVGSEIAGEVATTITIAAAVGHISYDLMQMVSNQPTGIYNIAQPKTAPSPALQQSSGPPDSGDDCRECSTEDLVKFAGCLTPDCLPGSGPRRHGEAQKMRVPEPKANKEQKATCGTNPTAKCDQSPTSEKGNGKTPNPKNLNVNQDSSGSTRPPDPEIERMIRRRECIIALGTLCTIVTGAITESSGAPVPPGAFAPMCALTAKVACELAVPEPARR